MRSLHLHRELTDSSLFTATLLLYLTAFFAIFASTAAVPLTSSLEENVVAHQRGSAVTFNHTYGEGLAPGLSKRNEVKSKYPIPGVDAVVEKIRDYGTVEAATKQVFYTGYPLKLDTAQQWASCKFDEAPLPSKADYKYVCWFRLANNAWLSDQGVKIDNGMRSVKFPKDEFAEWRDKWLKNIAQAYAQEAVGDIYLVVKASVTPDDISWDPDTAWGGWEYPALTRSGKPNQIIRVDPDTNVEKIIWRKGDASSRQEPKGWNGPTTPYFDM